MPTPTAIPPAASPGHGPRPATRAVPALLAVALQAVFYLPRVPSPAGAGQIPGLDKLVHIALFGFLVWALARFLAPVRRFPVGWVVIGAIVHAIVVELIQGALLPDRAASPGDLAADAVGIAAGLGAWAWERRVRARAGASEADAAAGGGGVRG
ncbi:VanZ family protein [Brachybacterium sp. EF45031]|uniref:VanZ family protein n=1 Tax=Brachybacterium sillae TaxID=2810536 RepID=UPI00217F030A|nr:VanZ family protein [Brachybacterium sillae]MCS6710971.1 VanZ family protein [Brachybacterium sillae]